MVLKESFFGAARRKTFICCRNVQISASSVARDRSRSTTIQLKSLQRSLIPHEGCLNSINCQSDRFATGTGKQTGNFFETVSFEKLSRLTHEQIREHSAKLPARGNREFFRVNREISRINRDRNRPRPPLSKNGQTRARSDYHHCPNSEN